MPDLTDLHIARSGRRWVVKEGNPPEQVSPTFSKQIKAWAWAFNRRDETGGDIYSTERTPWCPRPHRGWRRGMRSRDG